MEADTNRLVERLGALAQGTRIGVFKLLMRQCPDGLAAGDIADTLKVAPNTLSAHLSVLQRAGLIEQERRGRHIYYSADLEAVGTLMEALINDCCHGHPVASGFQAPDGKGPELDGANGRAPEA